MTKALTLRRRILIAEDNEDAGTSLQMLLETLGHDVKLVRNGESAVRDALTFRPDVILMDIGLPIINGLDATHLIRKSNPGRQILIIALTGWGQQSDIDRSTAAGMDLHLTKPVDFQKLKATLESWTERNPN